MYIIYNYNIIYIIIINCCTFQNHASPKY